MVATMSPEEAQLDESMSTCRFSQRVAMVSNRMEINEEVDPKLLVARLKSELRELKEEIQVLRGEGYDRAIAALSDGEKERCAELVDQYVTDGSEGATLNPGEMAKVQYCFRLRERASGGGGGGGGGGASAAGGGNGGGNGGGGGGGGGASESEAMETLRMQLQQRDHEIKILVSMLNKAPGAPGGASDGGGPSTAAAAAAVVGGMGAVRPPLAPMDPQAAAAAAEAARAAAAAEAAARREKVRQGVENVGRSDTEEAALLIARNEVRGDCLSATTITAATAASISIPHHRRPLPVQAFEGFRRSYRKGALIEENKATLRQRYEEAKALGESVNGARACINALKGRVETCRQKRAAAGVADGGGALPSPEEEALVAELDGEKRKYKEGFGSLRELKGEIEHLQHLLEQARA